MALHASYTEDIERYFLEYKAAEAWNILFICSSSIILFEPWWRHDFPDTFRVAPRSTQPSV